MQQGSGGGGKKGIRGGRGGRGERRRGVSSTHSGSKIQKV